MKTMLILGLSCTGLIFNSVAQPSTSLILNSMDQISTINEASKLEENGQFKAAAQVLSGAIESKKYSGAELKKLEFELDRLDRIKKDYPYTQDGLFSDLQGAVKDLTEYE